MSEPALTMFVGNRNPSIADVIRVDGVPVDLSGATVKFRMRLEGSATLKVDAAATVTDAVNGAVRYDWQAADVDTAGEYYCWWQVTAATKTQDTPEQVIAFVLHADAPVGQDLCTIADYREQTEQSSSSTTPNDLLALMISSASRVISERAQREFISTASGSTTRVFRVDSRVVNLAPYDLRDDPTEVELHPESTSPSVLTPGTGYVFTTGGLMHRRLIRLSNLLDIGSDHHANFGFAQLGITSASWGLYANTAAVPDDLRRACVLTVATWLDRSISSLSIPDFGDGGERGFRPDGFGGWPVPTAALHLLRPYMVPVVV